MKKKQMNKLTFLLLFDKGNNKKKYKIQKICNIMVYAKKSKSSDLLRIYYVVL